MVMLTNPPARWITTKIINAQDSFNAHVIVEVLVNVALMSIFMTVFGTWIGKWEISLDPFRHFIYAWPRNFAFAIEILIAHPCAHFVMNQFHIRNDS